MFPHAYLRRQLDPQIFEGKKRRRLCVSWGCQRRANYRQRKLRCHTCESRLKRLRNPLRYAYQSLKDHAKGRGIGFELTIQQFEVFCLVTGYLVFRGRDPASATVDRIKHTLPYRYDNIRCLTHADNSAHLYDDPY